MKQLAAFGLLLVLGAAGAFGQGTNVSAIPQQITLLTSSSLVYDSANRNLGYLEAVVADEESGKIQFGLVSLANPAYRSVVTPIPWPLMQRISDAQSAGGTPGKFQKFSVSVSRETLLRAPRVNMGARAGIDDAVWMASSYQYFGAIGGMGAPVNSSGLQKGGETSITQSSDDDELADQAEAQAAGPRPYYSGLTGAVEDIMYMGTNLYGPDFRSVILEIVSPPPPAAPPPPAPDPGVSQFIQASNFFSANIFRLTNSTSVRKPSSGNSSR